MSSREPFLPSSFLGHMVNEHVISKEGAERARLALHNADAHFDVVMVELGIM